MKKRNKMIKKIKQKSSVAALVTTIALIGIGFLAILISSGESLITKEASEMALTENYLRTVYVNPILDNEWATENQYRATFTNVVHPKYLTILNEIFRFSNIGESREGYAAIFENIVASYWYDEYDPEWTAIRLYALGLPPDEARVVLERGSVDVGDESFIGYWLNPENIPAMPQPHLLIVVFRERNVVVFIRIYEMDGNAIQLVTNGITCARIVENKILE